MAGQATAGTGTSSTGGSTAGASTTAGAAGTQSAGVGGGSAGTAGASLGGTGSGDASGAAGTGGAGGSAGTGGWVKIFNGTDLTGWVPLIHKVGFNNDTYDTFRADAANKVIKVTYEDYPNQAFQGRCGVLYYNKKLTNYRVRVTYRFVQPQANDPQISWGKNNSGLMIFGTDPAMVTGDPEFPPLIEIQLLGGPTSGGGSTTPNICTPGGMTLKKQTGGCGNNNTGAALPPAGDWITVEAEVHVKGDTKVFQYPNMTTPILTIAGPVYQGKDVVDGYLGLQSESQPLEFKDVELMELEE